MSQFLLKFINLYQGSLNYEMNSPYINRGYQNHAINQNGTENLNFIQSYQSQSTLHYTHNNDLSKSSKLSNIQSSSYLNSQNSSISTNKDISLKKTNFKRVQNKNSQQMSKNQKKVRISINTQQGDGSIQWLHKKIDYLQNQLQQLTKLLHEQSRQSGYSQNDGYEQIAIQNAQLTIKVQQLQQQKLKMIQKSKLFEQQKQRLNEQYERQHRSNNELKQKIIQYQHKINKLELNLNQYQSKIAQLQKTIAQISNQNGGQSTSKKIFAQNSSQRYLANNNSSLNIQGKQNNAYTATLQRQNARLNQQIQNLLEKMHNLNNLINQQQSSKQQIMQTMNKQLVQMQKLRKELSDLQVQKLEIEQANNYLKQEINQINQINSKKNIQIQNKFIKDQVQNKYKYEQIQQQIARLKQQSAANRQLSHNLQEENKFLVKQNQKLQSLLQSKNFNSFQLSPSIKSQTLLQKGQSNVTLNKSKVSQHKSSSRIGQEKDSRLIQKIQQSYKSELNFLNSQLQQQKERHALIKTKYNQMLSTQQNRLHQLQSQNRKLSIQLRTLRVEIQDKRKQIEQKQKEVQQKDKQLYQLNRSRLNSWNSYSQTQTKISIQNTKIVEQYENKVQSMRQQYYILTQRLQNQVTVLKRQISSLQSQNTKLNNLLTNLQAQKRSLQSQIVLKHRLESELEIKESQNKSLQSQIDILRKQIKDKQIQYHSKDYLISQLHLLQQRHQQLIKQVKNFKSKESVQTQLYNNTIKQISLQKQAQIQSYQNQILELKSLLSLNQQRIRNMWIQINQQSNRRNHQVQQQKQAQLYYTFKGHGKQSKQQCLICPQILKEFGIYKQLMQLKFQTMNQMLDQVKVQFTNNQIRLHEEIDKDKYKYNSLIHQYSQHDKQYRVLMERLWQWQKINAKNQQSKINIYQHRIKSNHFVQSNNHKLNANNHQDNQARSNINKLGISPSSHLTQVEYDLYLIKLQNSTLRSQIANLQKQLSQRGKNSQLSQQMQQLKKYNNNLLYQNQQLKSHLNQVVSQKSIRSSNILINESVFQKYSKVIKNVQNIQKGRHEQKALASAQLLINKLKKENDNLIEQRKLLQDELQSSYKKQQALKMQLQQLKQSRLNYRQSQANELNKKENYELLDRHSIPIEMIKHHPEHKKLQSQYLALKRSYLQLQLSFKKSRQYYTQQLQKMKIQNKFHLQRIKQLENKQQPSSSNLFSFNPFTNQNSSNNHLTIKSFKNQNNNDQILQSKQVNQQYIDMKQQLQMYQRKNKTLQERVRYLEQEVSIKIQECQTYINKYQHLLSKISHNSSQSLLNQQQDNQISIKIHNQTQKQKNNFKGTDHYGNNKNKSNINSIKNLIPKLNFQNSLQNQDFNQQQNDKNRLKYQNQLNKVINQTLVLKNQRRNGLQKFKIQINSLAAK